MHISEVCSIVEAVLILSALTKRTWTEDEFVRAVIRLRLPVYAAAPYDASIVSKRYVNDRLVVTDEPSLRAQYVTLLQAEIEELAYSPGPQVVTDRPAWLWGDKPYQSWDSIAAFRQGNHRVIGYWETEQDEWMGESNEYFFSKPVQVTAQSTFVVPRHTIAELVRNEAVADPHTTTLGRANPHTSPVLVGDGRGAVQGAQAVNSAPSEILPPTVANATSALPSSPHGGTTSTPRAKKTNTWDQHGLRRLLEESLLPGNTQAVLAEKYGVTRQFIGRQLAKAKDVHGVRPASPFDVLSGRVRKK